MNRPIQRAAVWSLALVAALYRRQGGGRWSLALCGVSTGLALLSKSPALILLGLIPLALQPRRGRRINLAEMRAGLRDTAVWALLTLLTVIIGNAEIALRNTR